jgi:hypothetical protein
MHVEVGHVAARQFVGEGVGRKAAISSLVTPEPSLPTCSFVGGVSSLRHCAADEILILDPQSYSPVFAILWESCNLYEGFFGDVSVQFEAFLCGESGAFAQYEVRFGEPLLSAVWIQELTVQHRVNIIGWI